MATTPNSGIRSGNDRAVWRRVSMYSTEDKENFDIYGLNPSENQKRSPLPEGFPRKPLNDITAILQSLQDLAGEGSSKQRKSVGKCARSYQLVESPSLTGTEVGFTKKSKGKSNPEARPQLSRQRVLKALHVSPSISKDRLRNSRILRVAFR